MVEAAQQVLQLLLSFLPGQGAAGLGRRFRMAHNLTWAVALVNAHFISRWGGPGPAQAGVTGMGKGVGSGPETLQDALRSTVQLQESETRLFDTPTGRILGTPLNAFGKLTLDARGYADCSAFRIVVVSFAALRSTNTRWSVP
eukprot:362705-Chlamydomonas_euryale.AAC.3